MTASLTLLARQSGFSERDQLSVGCNRPTATQQGGGLAFVYRGRRRSLRQPRAYDDQRGDRAAGAGNLPATAAAYGAAGTDPGAVAAGLDALSRPARMPALALWQHHGVPPRRLHTSFTYSTQCMDCYAFD